MSHLDKTDVSFICLLLLASVVVEKALVAIRRIPVQATVNTVAEKCAEKSLLRAVLSKFQDKNIIRYNVEAPQSRA